MSFYPENAGNQSSFPQNDLEFSSVNRSIQSCFQVLQEPSCRKSPSARFRSNWITYDYNLRSDRKNHRQHFFDPTGTNTITISDRIEKTHGSVAGNHRQYFFDPTGSNTITISDRIETSALFFDLAGSNTIAINDWQYFCDPIGDCNRIGPSWIEKSADGDFFDTIEDCN